MSFKMRRNKDGGISPCRSPRDKVGKGRCYHVLGDVDSIELIYNKEEKCYYVDITKDEVNKITLTAQKKIITDFLKVLEESLDDDQREKIFSFLRKAKI